jgi:DNA-directed RNA polymerase subunit RPC12/RpoP
MMSGREYVCAECRHHFRTPDDVPRNARALMCPSCGSVDLTIVNVQRPQPQIMRAKSPARIGHLGQTRDSEGH